MSTRLLGERLLSRDLVALVAAMPATDPLRARQAALTYDLVMIGRRGAS